MRLSLHLRDDQFSVQTRFLHPRTSIIHLLQANRSLVKCNYHNYRKWSPCRKWKSYLNLASHGLKEPEFLGLSNFYCIPLCNQKLIVINGYHSLWHLKTSRLLTGPEQLSSTKSKCWSSSHQLLPKGTFRDHVEERARTSILVSLITKSAIECRSMRCVVHG